MISGLQTKNATIKKAVLRMNRRIFQAVYNGESYFFNTEY